MKELQRISIDTGTLIRAALVVISVVLLFTIRDLLLALLVAVVIASAATPAINLLSKIPIGKFKLPRAAAGGVVYFVAISFLVLFFYFFVPVLINEITSFLNTLPEFTGGTGIDSAVVDKLSFEELTLRLQSATGVIGDNAFAMIGAIFGGLFNFVLIIMISFYLAIQKNGVGKFLALITPERHDGYVASLWNRSQRKIGRWFQGMAIDSLAVGIFIYIGLLILGVPYAFFFALSSTLLNFIPIVGPTLAIIPAAAIGFIEGGVLLGVLVAVLYIGVQLAESNILFPLVVGKAVGVSPVAILLAVGIGAKLGGFLGVIIAVPISAVTLEFLEDMRKRNENKKADSKSSEKKPTDLKALAKNSEQNT